MKIKKKFLVLGHPRSGTGFMSALFNKFGYNVGHETMGKDGISSWMFAVDDNQVYGEIGLTRKDFEFDYVIMNIRDPISIVSSTFYTENTATPSLEYRKKHINLSHVQNEIDLSVKSVLGWYSIIEKQNPDIVIKVDELPEQSLCSFLNLAAELEHSVCPDAVVQRNINGRKHETLSHTDLIQACNKQTVQEFENFCNRYGYYDYR
ncbi:hypothetical protein [Priestia flexa]|uniref:Sulfotransferase family protein n=1 Tax=Priestia flexa TaxID=86664 RepID=A0ABU4JC36_9BACI|nr:hypothetical protein [Priestia flexa]MDW8518559.1 hypothetical protein [Priestia flexa]